MLYAQISNFFLFILFYNFSLNVLRTEEENELDTLIKEDTGCMWE